MDSDDDWLDAPNEKPAGNTLPALPLGTRELAAAATAQERRAQFVSAWESLPEQQRVFLNTWRECRFNTRKTLRVLAGTSFGTAKSTVYNWGANDAFELVRNALRDASVEEILSRANLAARHDDIVEEALTPKPILYQGEHTGFEEIELGTAAKANETLLRLGGHLKDKDLEINVGIVGPSFTIQVVQPDGAIIDVTPKGVPIALPEPEVEDADWVDA